MKHLLIISMIILLSGCGLAEKICRDAIITEKTVNIDPRFLEECKELVVLPTDKPTFENVLANTVQNTVVYTECRNKQHDSIVVIKKFSNIKE